MALSVDPLDVDGGGTEVVEERSGRGRRLTRRRSSQAPGSVDPVADAGEQMRQRLARELHDQVAQGLTTMLLQLEQLRSGSPDADNLRKELAGLQTDAREMLAGVRNLLYELRGGAAAATDLVASLGRAIERIQAKYAVACVLTVAPGWPADLASHTAHHLYRIIHEAVENAIRHGRARKIS